VRPMERVKPARPPPMIATLKGALEDILEIA